MSNAPPITAGPENPAVPEIPSAAVVCLSLAAFGSGAALRVNDALLPRLALEFGITIGEAAQVISIFAIAYGLAQLLFGPAGDRFGKYRVIAWASLASALTTALCAAAPSFDSLRIARLLAGATAAAIIPLSMAWIGDVVAYEQRQPVLARFLIGQIFGLAAGVTLGGFAADHLSWRLPFVLLALLFAAIAAVLFTINRRLPAHARAMRKPGPGQGSALAHMASDFAHVLAMPWARVILATVFLEGMFLYGPFAFVAAHLHRTFGLSLSAAGAVVMLFGAGGFIFALGSARLVARLGELGLARGGGAVLAIALLGMGLAPQWLWSLPASLLAGLGFYMLHNTLQVNATQMAPQRRGAAVSAFASCFFLGQSAGVGLAGAIVGRTGTAALMGGGAIGVLLVALNFARLRARR
ncbi:MFS transporter [Roseateles violae]|uniref:MFS transporter n=1 Tax=Roseateles violae TaxID=3058042 RepID=A0ABT8DVY2_9BURK|nr:MFS transporter [Pelomonas sp. PFR6]MDN3922313.1 MFS transporter [Pelomonas sp. PFR6]